MNVRKWRYAPEPPALKGVLPQIYAIRHIGRKTIELAYTSFSLQKYISHGHIGPCYMYPGVYTNTFSFTLIMVVFTALYEHILSHFVNSYSLFVISIFDTYLSMCVPILWYVSSYLLFVIHYDSVYLSLLLHTNTLARPPMLTSLSA